MRKIPDDNDGQDSFTGELSDEAGVVDWLGVPKPRVDGACVVVVGYIPSRCTLPDDGWSELGWFRRLAGTVTFTLLGNHRLPTQPFCICHKFIKPSASSCSCARTSLEDFREKKEFRACVWFSSVELVLNNKKSVVRWSGGSEIGFTPPYRCSKYRINRGHFRRGHRYAKVNPTAEFTEQGVTLVVEAGFRVAEIPVNIGNVLLFGGRVPYMGVRLTYRLSVDGTTSVVCQGSTIPSIRLQSDQRLASELAMDKGVNVGDLIDTLSGGAKREPLWNKRTVTL